MILLDELPLSIKEECRSSNIQAVTVHISKKELIIEPHFKICRIPTILRIDRERQVAFECRPPIDIMPDSTPRLFSHFLGVLNMNGKKVLVMAEQVSMVCCICNRDVFLVTKPMFLFVNPNDKERVSEEEAEILMGINQAFRQGMYFSFAYELTSPLKESGANSAHIQMFNWARFLHKELKDFDRLWRVSLIQGFVGKVEVHLYGYQIRIALISRRSVHNAGTKQTALGVNAQGYSGNFVETEQIVTVNEFKFSFVQVRGSVPIIWRRGNAYKGLLQTVKLQGTYEQNFEAFNKHIERLKSSYGSILLLNLLSQKKESKLVQNYQYLVRERAKALKDPERLLYAYFDLHQCCSNKNYDRLTEFFDLRLDKTIESFGFTCLKSDAATRRRELLCTQAGLIRTNCFNCIDRTNIAQCRIAYRQFIFSLKLLGLDTKQLDKDLSVESPFAVAYRNLWADNGDMLSRQFTGTGATESYAIRKGKLSYLTTFDHGMKSIARAVRNLRDDQTVKDTAIAFLLGLNQEATPKEDSQSNSIQSEKTISEEVASVETVSLL